MFLDRVIEIIFPGKENFVKFIFQFVLFVILAILLIIFSKKFSQIKTDSLFFKILQLLVRSIYVPLIIFFLVGILANENNFFLSYTDEYIVFIIRKFKVISFTWLSWLCFVNIIRNIEEIISKTKSDESKIKLLNILITVVKISAYIILTLMILRIFGFNISTIIEKAGGSTAIITSIFILMYRSQVSNILTGFTLLLNKNFRVGNRMVFPEKNISGRIMSIGLNKTMILNDEEKVVVYPNSFLSNTPYYSLSDFKNSLIKIKVFIDNKSYDKVDNVVTDIRNSIVENSIVNKNLRISVFVNEIDLNGALILQVEYFVKCVNLERLKSEKHSLLLNILEICSKNKCSIYEMSK